MIIPLEEATALNSAFYEPLSLSWIGVGAVAIAPAHKIGAYRLFPLLLEGDGVVVGVCTLAGVGREEKSWRRMAVKVSSAYLTLKCFKLLAFFRGLATHFRAFF